MKDGWRVSDEAAAGSGISFLFVMAGLIPAIHVFAFVHQDVGARQRRQVYAVCASLTALPGMTTSLRRPMSEAGILRVYSGMASKVSISRLSRITTFSAKRASPFSSTT